MFHGAGSRLRAKPSRTKTQSFSRVVRANGTGARLGPVTALASRLPMQELLDHGATVVVLSRGMAECLHVPRETLIFLKERQIAAHVLPTKEAVALYNKLAQTEPVGGLFHTTC